MGIGVVNVALPSSPKRSMKTAVAALEREALPSPTRSTLTLGVPQLPLSSQRSVAPQSVFCATGANDALPFEHVPSSQGASAAGVLVSSSLLATPPLPSQTCVLQSPAVCTVTGVFAGVSLTPHWPVVHVRFEQSVSVPGQSAGVEHCEQLPMPSHACVPPVPHAVPCCAGGVLHVAVPGLHTPARAHSAGVPHATPTQELGNGVAPGSCCFAYVGRAAGSIVKTKKLLDADASSSLSFVTTSVCFPSAVSGPKVTPSIFSGKLAPARP